jgi:Bacteriophage Mu Gp45 spike protein
MVHRSTPLNSIFRAYTAGGARGVVDQIDDSQLMQAMGGNFMHGESRKDVEAPQNYGFSSVTFDAEKDAMGAIQSAAEHFSSFIGGNRTLAVAAAIDDRWHRLINLLKGDTAMFRGRGDKQQFHMSEDGGFWTAPQDKTVRMHLLQEDSESNSTQQSGGGGSSGGGSSGGGGAAVRIPQQGDLMPDGKRLPKPTPLNGSSGGSGGSNSGGQQQNKGQQARYKDGQKSPMFVEVTKDKTRMGGNTCHMVLSDGNTYVHCHTDKQVYVGAEAGKAKFDKLATLSGPCVNALGKIG